MSDNLPTNANTNDFLPAELQQQLASASAVVKKETDSAGYFAQLLIMQPQSKIRQQKKLSEGAMVLKKKDYVQLSEQVDVLCIFVKTVARDYGTDPITVSTDAESDIYKAIIDKAERLGRDSNCAHGPEYFFYCPQMNQYFTLHCSNKTLKNLASSLNNMFGKYLTLSTEFVENKKGAWYALKAEPCGNVYEMPDKAELSAQVQKWIKNMTRLEESESESNTGSDTSGREV